MSEAVFEWEYKVEGKETGMYYDSFFEGVLKPLGEEGWECIHITERNAGIAADDTVHLKGYFRRRKK